MVELTGGTNPSAVHKPSETPGRVRLPSYGIGHHMLWGTAGELRPRGVQVLMAKEALIGKPQSLTAM